MDSEGRRITWLADRIGKSQPEVSRWVNGVHRPMRHHRESIAEALGRDVYELWPDHDTDGKGGGTVRGPIQTSETKGRSAA